MGKYKGKKQNNDIKESEQKMKGSFFIKSKETKFSEGVMKKNHNSQSVIQENTTNSKDQASKRPFDKKQWRLKKYSHKYKVEKWKELRKKKILNEYQKVSKRKDCQGLNVQKIYEKYDNESELDGSDPLEKNFPKAGTSQEEIVCNEEESSKPSIAIKKPKHKIKKTKLEEIREEKQKKHEEYLKRKTEKEEALKLLKKKKAERYKRLNKRTKKGQPIMKDRMEMLFEQVQRICQD